MGPNLSHKWVLKKGVGRGIGSKVGGRAFQETGMKCESSKIWGGAGGRLMKYY